MSKAPAAAIENRQDEAPTSSTKIEEIRADRLLERLKLERNIRVNCCGCLLLIGSLVSFLVEISYAFPPEEGAAVHRRLEAAMGLKSTMQTRSLNDIYSFVEQIGNANTALQATDAQSWCEVRYDQTYGVNWDAKSMQPKPECPTAGSATEPLANSTWRRMKQFVGPQVSVLPVLLYQTKFDTKSCTGFAKIYAEAPIMDGTDDKPDQFFQPPLDGSRSGNLLTCVDRDKKLNVSYGIVRPCNGTCPEEGQTEYKESPRETFRNETVYSKLILQPSADVTKMKALDYLDATTDRVSISALIYTEGVEIFTCLTVDFTVGAAGSVTSIVRMSSWKQLSDSQNVQFIVAAACAALLAGLAIVWSLQMMVGKKNLSGAMVLDVFARVSLFTMALSAMAWKLRGDWKDNDIKQLYEGALSTWASVEDLTTEAGSTTVIKKFLQIVEELESRQEEFDGVLLPCFVAILANLCQLVMHFNAHPRTAVLSSTIVRTLSRLLHICVMFLPAFLFFGFVGFLMFGYELDSFSTYGKVLTTQIQMLYGDFIAAPGVPNLGGADSVMYWIHAIVFMLLMYVVLRMLVLAVVFDAFIEARRVSLVTANSTLWDLYDSVYKCSVTYQKGTAVGNRRERWPRHDKVIKWLEKRSGTKDMRNKLDASVLQEAFTKNAEGESRVELFDRFAKDADKAWEEAKPPSSPQENAEEKRQAKNWDKKETYKEVHARFSTNANTEWEDAKKLSEDFIKYYSKKMPAIDDEKGRKGFGAASVSGGGADSIGLRAAGAGDAAPNQPQVLRRLDPERIARKVVSEVTQRLAEKAPQNVDRFVTIGRLSCVISREFKACGLIT